MGPDLNLDLWSEDKIAWTRVEEGKALRGCGMGARTTDLL